MVIEQFQPDFKEFLKLLNGHGINYWLIDGYAVAHHGYSRPTNDIDVWIDNSPTNSAKVITALTDFGFPAPDPAIFRDNGKILRMGVPPVRIEMHMSIDGVDFNECFNRREMVPVEDIIVPVISLEDLKQNKKASGRLKDLVDLEHLSLD